MALLIVGIRVALRLAQAEPSLISISALGWLGALFALIWQMNWVPWIGWSYNAMLWVMLGLMDGAQRLVAQDAGGSAIEMQRIVIPMLQQADIEMRTMIARKQADKSKGHN